MGTECETGHEISHQRRQVDQIGKVAAAKGEKNYQRIHVPLLLLVFDFVLCPVDAAGDDADHQANMM